MKDLSTYSRIIRLGIPILIGQVGMIIVGFADTKMVGLYATDALASASFVNNVFNVPILGCLGFTFGLTPLIGSLFSQKRITDCGGMVKAGLVVNLFFALLATLLMSGVYFALPYLGQPEELLPLIRPYYIIAALGVIPVTVFNVFAQWAYAINRTRLPMWIILFSNVLNIFGNWLLIYGNWGLPELGLTGAGISTLVARVVCPLIIITIFFLKPDYREYAEGFRGVALRGVNLRRVFTTSWPVSLQMICETCAFSLTAVMAGWISAFSLAALQIILIVGTLGFCIYYSMAAAVSVLVANANGLGNVDEMRRVSFCGYRIILMFATCSSTLFALWGSALMHQFSDDPQVLAIASTLIVPLVLYQYADATQICFANALRGTGQVMPMLWIAVISYLIIGLPSTYFIAFTLDMSTYGIVLSWSVSLVVAAVLYYRSFIRATKAVAAK